MKITYFIFFLTTDIIFIQEKPTLHIFIEKEDIWGGQRTLQFKMMKCYSLHTKIKNEVKLKKMKWLPK